MHDVTPDVSEDLLVLLQDVALPGQDGGLQGPSELVARLPNQLLGELDALALHAVIFVKLAEPASVLLRRPLAASFRRRVRPCIIGCFSCEKGGQQLDCLPLSLPLAATHGEWAPRPTRK